MDKLTEHSLKDNAFRWATWEYQHDQGYWQDRAKNGLGLIQQIARFVLKQASGGQK